MDASRWKLPDTPSAFRVVLSRPASTSRMRARPLSSIHPSWASTSSNAAERLSGEVHEVIVGLAEVVSADLRHQFVPLEIDGAGQAPGTDQWQVRRRVVLGVFRVSHSRPGGSVSVLSAWLSV